MMAMRLYKTCDNCGANLDPGERCDCEREYRALVPKIRRQSKVEKKII